MLQALSIRDFIIVESLDLEFSQGFTTLTGETGAGKSILIDALSLALGARNDGAVTRKGADKADISASFFIKNNVLAKSWLTENELESSLENQAELILRRVIYADGRSRGFINGVAATAAQLKDLGEYLIDIYSQNAHHSLLKTNTQRQILDEFAGDVDLANQVANQYKMWHKLNFQRTEVEKNSAAYADELAELRDKTRELKQLGFTADEWAELQQEHNRLANGAGLLTVLQACMTLLDDNETSINGQLTLVQQKLAAVVEFDVALIEAADNVDSALITLEETSRSLNRYLQNTELDPTRLADVENRLQSIHNIGRKYRVKPEELPDLLAADLARMSDLDGFANDGALAKQEAQALDLYQVSAKQLSENRQKSAKILSLKISAEMQRLSLSGGQFSVALQTCEASANGLETVEFLVAGHAGVEPRPLNKVASGGELSRISLALHVTTAAQDSVPCMIFDEVDVGIGGGVAEVVGQLLKQLGAEHQVLVITHLPQVAAQAAQHLQVSKSQSNGATLSHIQALDKTERIEEIARMLGGLNITETTRSHAKEMLGV
ncbi:MAG: DNA repair protein RecN [Bdellovibrio sp.]|nr:DNA repair protein RecN [Methylotenera sp.]